MQAMNTTQKQQDTPSASSTVYFGTRNEVQNYNTSTLEPATLQALPTPPTSPIDYFPKKDAILPHYPTDNNRKRSYSITFADTMKDTQNTTVDTVDTRMNNIINTNKKQKVDLHCLDMYLSQRHSTPNLCDAQLKRSLLNWACLGQSTEAVKRLLTNAHLDINLRSGPRKTTALHEACSVGFSEGVTLLLAHPEVDINATTDDHQGLTPVHMAVQANQVECLRLLLAAGARVDLFACDTGRLPIHTAVLFGYQQCVSLLLKSCYNNNSNNNFQGHLQNTNERAQEICRNNPEQLDLLWTPNKLDQRSAIEMAIVTGLTSTLQLLLDYDGHCSIVETIESSPAINELKKTKKQPPSLPLTRPDLIDLAIEWNRIEMLRLLIKRGCKVSAKSLLKAVQQRKIDMVRELVTSGKVDPTATSTHTLSTTCSSGYNPSFLYAANHGFLDMIPLLLTLNTSKDCIQQALLLASSIGLRDQLAHTIVFTLKSLAAIAAKKSSVN